MATVSGPLHSHNLNASSSGLSSATFAVDPAEPMHITSPQLDEMGEEIRDLKKTIIREGDDDRMQDLIDLTRVMIDEMREMRKEMVGIMQQLVQQPIPAPIPQPQPKSPYQPWGTGTGNPNPYTTQPDPDGDKYNDQAKQLPDEFRQKMMGDFGA